MITKVSDGVHSRVVITVWSIKTWVSQMYTADVAIGFASNAEMNHILHVIVPKLRIGIRRILMKVRISLGY